MNFFSLIKLLFKCKFRFTFPKHKKVLINDGSLSDFVFEGLNMSMRTYITDRVRMAILYHERRIELNKIDFDQTRIAQGEVHMIVHYTVRLTNSRGNMVYPFYINEGTELK